MRALLLRRPAARAAHRSVLRPVASVTRSKLAERFTLAFQNTDGDTTPSLTGDITITVEAPRSKGRLRRLLGRRFRHFFPRPNYRMTTSWAESVFSVDEGESGRQLIPVHGPSHGKPPSPRRDITLVKGTLSGWAAALIGGHAVNSAWAPRWKPTTFRAARRRLWWKWFRKNSEVVKRMHRQNRLVIAAVDGNRMGRWAFPGMVTIFKHGPDRVMVTRRHASALRLAEPVEIGRKVGDGRVTHHSVRLTLELDRSPKETR